MSVMTYQDVSEVSFHIDEALQAARVGLPVSVIQDARRFAFVEVDRLLAVLAAASPVAQVVHDGDRWCLYVPGLPVLAEGETVNDMLDDAIVVLRSYADDWSDGICSQGDDLGLWSVVQLIALSDDLQLRSWLAGTYG